MGIQRDDFRQVKPTEAELAEWARKNPRRAKYPPYRAEHLPCGKRIWYSGIGIGSHMRACPVYNNTTVYNDTYGEMTGKELAELRKQAHKCLRCGMLADVDPVLHASRYGHRPQYRDEQGTWEFFPNTMTWTQV